MDYKEKYKAALSWMKKIYPTLTGADKEDAEHYFPEFHEIEDERVRLEIHAYLFNTLHNTQQLTPRTNELERWLAYLENKEKPMPDSTELDERWKQEKAMLKEKDFRGNEWRLAYNAYLDGFAYGVSIKQKEQPKEELVYRLNGLMQDYIKEGKDEEEKKHRFKCYKLFWDALEDAEFFEQKEQKPAAPTNVPPIPSRNNEQKPEEWSEEDEVMLANILGTYKTLEDMLDLSTGQNRDILESMNFEKDWLKDRFKSLRPQPKIE